MDGLVVRIWLWTACDVVLSPSVAIARMGAWNGCGHVRESARLASDEPGATLTTVR